MLFKLCLIVGSIGMIAGDAYYYNMRQWVKPMLGQVHNGAMNGMDHSRPLRAALNINTKDLAAEIAEKEIKAKIAEHLHHELGTILDEMQTIIDVVVQFSLESVKHLNSAIYNVNLVGISPEQVGSEYLENVVKTARNSAERIVKELRYKSELSAADHLSADVFQKLAIEIARDVLRKTSKENVQQCILKKIGLVLNDLLMDKDKEIELNLAKDLNSDLTQNVGLGHRVHSAEFKYWMEDLIEDAVNGARPQITLLSGYAKSVINDACSLSHKVVSRAYGFFEQRKSELGPVWDKMHHIVNAILQQEKEI